MCRRCETMCNEVQTVGALSAVNRGFMAVVAPAFEQDLEKSPCTYCGQCVAVCPTGALTEIDHTSKVIRAIADPTKTVLVQTAPAVRAALGEEFGMKPGTLVTGKMVSALRQIGFDYVFDTDFAADLTIMEEGTELLDRLTRFLNGDKSVKLLFLPVAAQLG
jgi:NADP-reducing hydrogenase subunit HndD